MRRGTHHAAIAVLSAVLASCSSLQIQLPLQTTQSDWQTDGRSFKRDHVAVDEPVQLPLEQAWIYNAAGGFASGSPLVVDGIVLVSTRKGEVHAIDLFDGQKVGAQEFGRSIEGTPSIAQQVLFVPNAWGKRALVAFDLTTGTRRWSYEGVPIEASVLPIRDLVVVGDVEGNVLGIRQETGQVVWLYEFGDFASVLSAPAAVDDQRVVVADETGRVAMLEAETGEELWLRDLDCPVEHGLATGYGLVFVPTTRGKFFALDPSDGSTVWLFDVGDQYVRLTSPAVTSDGVIFGGTDGIVRFVGTKNGLVRWTFQTDGTVAGAPVVNQNIVFVGAMDERIYALRRDNGSVQWQTELRGRIKSAPAVRNGYLIVLSEPRFVYAFTNAAKLED